jgi:membrane-bound metal-dependent hydrolase YbcI (DUF457 family)
LAFQKKTFNPFPGDLSTRCSMPSPVAHTLFGLTGLHLLQAGFPGSFSQTWPLSGLILLASLAPDLDFIPGLVLGDPGRYHQTLSHSLSVSFLAALALGSLARRSFPGTPWWRWVGLMLLFFLGHLVLDFFTEDTRPPIGFPLCWPFSGRLFTSPVPIFPYLLRDPARPGFWSHNLRTLWLEALLLALPWVVSWKLARERSNKP